MPIVITPYIGGTAQTPIDDSDVTDAQYDVTGLTHTAYTFTVAATDTVGTGLASAASNAVTPITVPGQPRGHIHRGKGSVKLTWKAPTSNSSSAITHYIVKSSTSASKTLGVVTSYTFAGLTNGITYTFTVTATNVAGNDTARPSRSR